MISSVVNLNSGTKLPLETDAWQLVQTKELELIELHLMPGKTIPKHRNPSDVLFYVLEGEGVLCIGSKSYSLNKGDCTLVLKEKGRSWLNTSDKKLKLLVIKRANKE